MWFRGDRIALASCIVVITALAWAYLVYLRREAGMVMDMPWGARDLLFTFVMWSVMMVGMMGPTAAPVLFLFAGTRSGNAERGVSPGAIFFGLGYIAVWVGFSVFAALAQWGLHEAAQLSPMMAASSSRLAGASLIGAGLFQLTPLKRACLSHCQSPLGFLMSHWREGSSGAFQMGLHHGIYCFGCCWAVMLLLFVVGVMNLAWVAAIAAFILLEKIGPSGALVSRIGGALMIAIGVAFVAA
jgi:predicted metal-binding membrane protein